MSRIVYPAPTASRDVLEGVVESAASEWVMIISLVFGGCCSNVWALEAVLRDHPHSGTLLTFAQFLFVTLQTLSSQLTFRPQGPLKLSNQYRQKKLWMPRLRPRMVPLKRWAVQVCLFLTVSLMNNFAFSYKVPMAVHIIFRSGGLVVSMATGYLFGGHRYSAKQVFSVLLLTAGIVLATMSAPRRPTKPGHSSMESTQAEDRDYMIGIGLLCGALVVSAFLGLWQEETYRRYGAAWREALFYSHAMALPFFMPFAPSITSTLSAFSTSPTLALFSIPNLSAYFAKQSEIPWPKPAEFHGPLWTLYVSSAWFALVVNVVTQALCVRGVNRLTSRVSSVTVNLVLTVRKAVSLAISVWYYGNGMTPGLAAGAAMVLGGTVLYSLSAASDIVDEQVDSPIAKKIRERELREKDDHDSSDAAETGTTSVQISSPKRGGAIRARKPVASQDR